MVTRLAATLSGQPPTLPVDESGEPALLVLSGLSLLLAAFGAHAGAALLVYSPSKLNRRMPAGSPAIDELRAHSREFELTAWVVTFAGTVAAVLLAEHAMASALPWVVTAAVATLFFCAALPIALAEKRAETVVLRLRKPLRALRLVLRIPVLLPMLTLTAWTLRALGIPETPPTDPDEIADEIIAAVSDSADENALEEKERDWIENIVELKDRHVSEAMTPRTDLQALEAQLSLRDAVARAVATGYSRYPVYEDKIDNVVGVFYAKDALSRLGNGGSEVAICEIMRPPVFVPKSMGVMELLEQFKTTKVQMAIVLDEYGGTAGLITLEDIVEEIVGDISDEYDPDTEDPIKVIELGRVLEISGKARVDEVNEELDLAIPENGEYDTVGGYIFTTLGRIPKTGDVHRGNGFEFTILTANERRIGRVRVTVAEPLPTDAEA